MDGMKILIAYDGTANSDAALESLRRAGLPSTAEVIVLTLSDVWLPSAVESAHHDDDDEETDDEVIVAEGRAVRALREARRTATIARDRLQKWFPGWSVRIEAHADAPGPGILDKAAEWKPDLLVVGTHGRSIVARVFLGSVSQRVLAEANCSVHIGRPPRNQDEPIRLIIGLDGSLDSAAAIDAMLRRSWPKGTEAHLVSAYAPLDLQYAPALIDPASDPRSVADIELRRIREQVEEAALRMESAGLVVVRSVRIGVPVPVLLDEAETWGADAIVLGARGHRILERILLGSVSAAVANRAGCSVDVIRPWVTKPRAS